MAEPASGTAIGTEISERTTELVLPSARAPDESTQSEDPPADSERISGLSEPEAPSRRPARASASGPGSVSQLARGLSPSPETPSTAPAQNAQSTVEAQRGAALPGDRGPRAQSSQSQRPSFWRRIALGGRKSNESAVVESKPSASPANPAAIETRIVEPLLQALVSVEAKLERSHVDLTQRSDQVEQRLTQLWDIEEQLGTLSELQESLLNVSEQQRRLATALESQTRTLRWLVGAIFFSLAAAAFVVAAVLQ